MRLAGVVLLSSTVLYGTLDVAGLYVKSVFGFSPKQNAYLAMLHGASGVIVSFVVLPALLRCLLERRVLLIGLIMQCVSSLLISTTDFKSDDAALTRFYVGSVLSAMGMLTFPAVAAIKANNVANSEQGTVQGALSGIQQISAIVGPFAFGGLFTLGNQKWSQPVIPYYLATGLALVAAILSWILPRSAQSAAGDNTTTRQDDAGTDSTSLTAPIVDNGSVNARLLLDDSAPAHHARKLTGEL